MSNRDIGAAKEAKALHFLKKQGLQLLCQNYHCRKGEIDLIMQHENSLVFIEVRYRRSEAFGTALESVDWRKQQKIIMTARHYLQQIGHELPECRFDVVTLHDNDIEPVSWLKNAFQIN